MRANNGSMVRIETILDSWKSIREDTAQAVEDFSAHDLDYKPAPDLMSFGGTARSSSSALLKGIVPPTTRRRQAKAGA